jgi:hypothetical protein
MSWLILKDVFFQSNPAAPHAHARDPGTPEKMTKQGVYLRNNFLDKWLLKKPRCSGSEILLRN